MGQKEGHGSYMQHDVAPEPAEVSWPHWRKQLGVNVSKKHPQSALHLEEPSENEETALGQKEGLGSYIQHDVAPEPAKGSWPHWRGNWVSKFPKQHPQSASHLEANLVQDFHPPKEEEEEVKGRCASPQVHPAVATPSRGQVQERATTRTLEEQVELALLAHEGGDKPQIGVVGWPQEATSQCIALEEADHGTSHGAESLLQEERAQWALGSHQEEKNHPFDTEDMQQVLISKDSDLSSCYGENIELTRIPTTGTALYPLGSFNSYDESTGDTSFEYIGNIELKLASTVLSQSRSNSSMMTR